VLGAAVGVEVEVLRSVTVVCELLLDEVDEDEEGVEVVDEDEGVLDDVLDVEEEEEEDEEEEEGVVVVELELDGRVVELEEEGALVLDAGLLLVLELEGVGVVGEEVGVGWVVLLVLLDAIVGCLLLLLLLSTSLSGYLCAAMSVSESERVIS
jgi:hypothetical protein